MRKKILLMLCICMCILGITACGTDPKEIDYNGYSYDELYNISSSTWDSLMNMDVAEMESFLDSIEEMSAAQKAAYMTAEQQTSYNLIKGWFTIREQAGKYEKIDSFQITKSGKTTNAELIIDCENRSVVLNYVYNNYDMQVKDIMVDIVYTTGEKMEKAALNTVMGMGTVFIMLIIICVIISGFSIIPKLEQSFKQKKQVPQNNIVPVPPKAEPVAEDAVDDLELIAVIAAAIAAQTGQSTDDFVVRSIKRR